MPTTIYSKTSGSFSFEGKEYAPVDGAVSVPDHAVKTLVESHGFTTSPPEDNIFDIKKLSKAQLVKLNKEAELGASIANTMSLEKIQELVIPLWEAKQAEIEEEKAAE